MAILRWSVKDLVDVIVRCVKNKFDAIVFIEGNRGLGKSTLGFKLATRLNAAGIKFNPETHIVYSREDTLRLLASVKKQVIFSDEMINVAYNREFFEKEQKQLLKALNMYRDSCNVFIGAIPRFEDLDTQIKRLCKIRICVQRRGVAAVFTQNRTMFSPDPWDTKQNMKVESSWRRGKRAFSKLSNFRGLLVFNDITKKQRLVYEEIKQRKRGHVFKDINDNDVASDPMKQWYDKVYDRLVNQGMSKDTFNMLCQVAGKKPSTVAHRINIMLKDDSEDRGTLREYLKGDTTTSSRKRPGKGGGANFDIDF